MEVTEGQQQIMWVTHELSMIATGKAELVGTDCRDNLLTDYMRLFQKDLTIQGCAQVLESASEITFLLLLILLAKVNSILVYDKITFVPLQNVNFLGTLLHLRLHRVTQ